MANDTNDTMNAENSNENKSITVDVNTLRSNLALDYQGLYPCMFEAISRTRRNYNEFFEMEFLDADEETLKEVWVPRYRDSILLEMIGALLSTAIRIQIDNFAKDGERVDAIEVAQNILKGSVFGQAFDASVDDINSLISDVVVETEMDETRERITKSETQKKSLVKISFEHAHFANIDSEDWHEFRPYLMEASFMTRNDLVRLIVYRECQFKLHHKEEIPELNNFLRSNNLPNKANVFRIGFTKLYDEIKRKNLNSGAWVMLDEMTRINKECGELLFDISPTRLAKFVGKKPKK